MELHCGMDRTSGIRRADGLFSCRIFCGVTMLLIGIPWLAEIAGVTVIDPVVLKGIFPAFLITFGLLLIIKALRRKGRHHEQA